MGTTIMEVQCKLVLTRKNIEETISITIYLIILNPTNLPSQHASFPRQHTTPLILIYNTLIFHISRDENGLDTDGYH